MGMINVNFAALEELRRDLDNHTKFLNSQLETMDKNMKELVVKWGGDAMELYERENQQINAALDSLEQTLAKIGTAVDAAREQYIEGERLNAQTFGG